LFESQHWNLPFAFRKADSKNADALAPYNKLAMQFMGGKDHGLTTLGACADFKFSEDDKKAAVKAEAKKIFDLLVKSHDHAESFSEDKKEGWYGMMSPSNVKTQLDAALKEISSCFQADDAEKADFKWPVKEGDKPKDDKVEKKDEENPEEKKDADPAEGGEPVVKSAEEFPKTLLEQYVKSPAIAGIIKSAVMQVELDSFDFFAFDKMGKAMAFFLPKPTEWASCDAILSCLIDLKEEKEEKELFGKAKLDAMDVLELDEASADKENTRVMLPGVTIWEAEADKAKACEAPDDATEVEISLTKAKAFEFEGSHLINRIACKVTAWDKENKKLTLEADDDLKFPNIKSAEEHFAKAGGDAVVEKATEEKNEEKVEEENQEKKD
jgi:hypothetical protein